MFYHFYPTTAEIHKLQHLDYSDFLFTFVKIKV